MGAPPGRPAGGREPVFTWMRLAQRIPMRIRLDALPDDLLAMGATCTITILPEQK